MYSDGLATQTGKLLSQKLGAGGSLQLFVHAPADIHQEDLLRATVKVTNAKHFIHNRAYTGLR